VKTPSREKIEKFRDSVEFTVTEHSGFGCLDAEGNPLSADQDLTAGQEVGVSFVDGKTYRFWVLGLNGPEGAHAQDAAPGQEPGLLTFLERGPDSRGVWVSYGFVNYKAIRRLELYRGDEE